MQAEAKNERDDEANSPNQEATVILTLASSWGGWLFGNR
jgi:hypothetical protein